MSEHAVTPVFTTTADQPVLPFLGAPERLLVAGEQSGGEFALFSSSGTRGHSTPWHRHLRASETFIVLEGTIDVQAGDDRRQVTAGGVAILPRDVPHGFVVTSDSARYLTLHTPAGFDHFVHEVSAVAHQGAPPDRDTLIRMAAASGIEILGLPLPLP
jgi:quercetin dioxygenase-like cupin family protein